MQCTDLHWERPAGCALRIRVPHGPFFPLYLQRTRAFFAKSRDDCDWQGSVNRVLSIGTLFIHVKSFTYLEPSVGHTRARVCVCPGVFERCIRQTLNHRRQIEFVLPKLYNEKIVRKILLWDVKIYLRNKLRMFSDYTSLKGLILCDVRLLCAVNINFWWYLMYMNIYKYI